MDLGNPSLLFLAILLAAPVLLVALINVVFHPRGGIVRGLGGALFIAVCWVAAVGSIVWRVLH